MSTTATISLIVGLAALVVLSGSMLMSATDRRRATRRRVEIAAQERAGVAEEKREMAQQHGWCAGAIDRYVTVDQIERIRTARRSIA